MTDMDVAEGNVGGWRFYPSLWFDACCLVPLVAELPFYTSRHELDAATWSDRVSANVRMSASRIRDWVSYEAKKPLPAFLALWTSPFAFSADPASELSGLIRTVRDCDQLLQRMAEISRRWSVQDAALFRAIQPDFLRVLWVSSRQAWSIGGRKLPLRSSLPVVPS